LDGLEEMVAFDERYIAAATAMGLSDLACSS
jgi:hypothetical protein